MRPAVIIALAPLCGCSLAQPVTGPAPSPVALPVRPDAAQEISSGAPRLPDLMPVGDTYRLLVLEGHWVLVRQPSAATSGAGPADTSHPEPLPQEFAAELADAREASRRMDAALAAVMKRSEELSEQARRLEDQSRAVAELLQEADTRLRDAPKEPHSP